MQGLEWEAYWHYMELCNEYNHDIIDIKDSIAWNKHYSELEEFNEQISNGGRAQ